MWLLNEKLARGQNKSIIFEKMQFSPCQERYFNAKSGAYFIYRVKEKTNYGEKYTKWFLFGHSAFVRSALRRRQREGYVRYDE
jgi:hypothetical protein